MLNKLLPFMHGDNYTVAELTKTTSVERYNAKQTVCIQEIF